MCSIITIHPKLQGGGKCQDSVSIVYHGLIAEREGDVTLPVISESVFISPHGRVTVNLFTCFYLNPEKTPDLGVAIRYELTGNISFNSQALYVMESFSRRKTCAYFEQRD